MKAVQLPEVTIHLYWLLSEVPVGDTTVYDEVVAPVMALKDVPPLVLSCH